VVKSPCVKICKIDKNSGFCTGCARNEYEVFNWINFPDYEKKSILTKLKKRVKDNKNLNILKTL